MGNRESPGAAKRPWLWQVKHSCHNELLLHWALPKMGFFFLALSFFSPDTSSLNNIILLCPSSTRCSLTVFSYSLSEESSAPTSPPHSLPASASNWKYYHASDKSISKDIPSSFPSRLFFLHQPEQSRKICQAINDAKGEHGRSGCAQPGRQVPPLFAVATAGDINKVNRM